MQAMPTASSAYLEHLGMWQLSPLPIGSHCTVLNTFFIYDIFYLLIYQK